MPQLSVVSHFERYQVSGVSHRNANFYGCVLTGRLFAYILPQPSFDGIFFVSLTLDDVSFSDQQQTVVTIGHCRLNRLISLE